MVDIHSHILAGLDDGADSMEQSLAMVKMAAEAGTTDIVATPHANPEYAFDPEVVAHKVEELAQACENTPRIHTGCDFHMTLSNIEDALANPSKYTINHKRYLLVELSDRLVPTTTDGVFVQMCDAGMIPVVTHPERNRRLHRRLDRVEKWVAHGACVQITADSLTGRFGDTAKAIASELIGRGLVHFIASDAHGVSDRKPVLDAVHAQVSERYGKTYADLVLKENPGAVLEGAAVTVLRPDVQARRKWYQFWRR
ncbi:MAG TPA: CpsB/CapC family capsule biosynthesis tyrosine phosphatase [Bryobacteraceae bacterium]|jgi:protein-tyrosine phosphatase|nr:CpsB/CapC family capsule biosynthesis tyrosine phosphatase [Bryobacteraceae bacterium]